MCLIKTLRQGFSQHELTNDNTFAWNFQQKGMSSDSPGMYKKLLWKTIFFTYNGRCVACHGRLKTRTSPDPCPSSQWSESNSARISKFSWAILGSLAGSSSSGSSSFSWSCFIWQFLALHLWHWEPRLMSNPALQSSWHNLCQQGGFLIHWLRHPRQASVRQLLIKQFFKQRRGERTVRTEEKHFCSRKIKLLKQTSTEVQNLYEEVCDTLRSHDTAQSFSIYS